MKMINLNLVAMILFFLISNLLHAEDINKLVRNGDLEKLKKEPLSSLAYDYKDSLGRNALSIAISSDQNEIAKYLIVGGIGINVRDFVGKTPLMSALVNKNNELVKMLLMANASTALKDKAGRDIVYYAETSKDEMLVKLAKDEHSKLLGPGAADLEKLKLSLLNLDHKYLVDFFNIYKTLDLKIDNITVVEFLIENNLLEKWGLSTFIEMGVNFNDSSAIFKAIDQ
jgi:ankyrin repeat protein